MRVQPPGRAILHGGGLPVQGVRGGKIRMGVEGGGVMATKVQIISALCCLMDGDRACDGDGCPFFTARALGGCMTAAIEAAIDELEKDRKAEQRKATRKAGR